MEIETGYIYCISNIDIMPGIYKVGVTMRSPLDRLKEANSSDTWKIPYYKIEFAKKVTNPKEKERTLHRLMEKFMKRVHPRREFFRGEIDDIKEAFKLMDGDLWNETPVEPVVRDEPIHFENRLSEDPDIRIQQIMELIQQVFKNHSVRFKENGKLSGHNHHPVMVDDIPIFIIENHDNGRRNVAMISTFPRNKVPDFINDYYLSLTWDLFGGSPIAIRKQYDTEGKTKEDIINVLKGFKTALSQKGGEIKKVDELEKVKSRVDKVKLKEDLKKKETEQHSHSMNYWYDNIKNWMGGNGENNNSPSIDSDDSNSQISENSEEENNGMKELEICKSWKNKTNGVNYWVLYNKRNHRCNNRRATYNELKYALDNWNTTEMIKPPCKIYFYPKGEYKSLLEKSLLFTESIEDKEVICVLGEDGNNEYLTTGECCWNKIIFYDSREKQYYLRSFTKMWKRGDGKELKKSRINGWYVDLSTMGATREFWDYLKNKLSTSLPSKNMKNWMGGNSENNNSPYIDSDDSNSQISYYSGEEKKRMKELEICKSSEHKRNGVNFWVLYNKRNHRCNNRRATYNELKYALDNWNTTEMIKPECKIIIYPPEKYKSLLEKCLLFTESKEDKEVICALGQDWGNEYLITGECSWNKIIVYDSREKQYYLRSFAKGSKRGDGKELIKSRVNGWYVDLSTMGAPREFWDYLKNKLSDPSQPSSHKVKRILWSDEEGEITDKFNNTYSFGDYWKPDNNYIKKIHKNGRLFKCEGGVHRGYSIWLDNEDIVHISHGHKNKDIISHCIFNDNSLTSGWMCNWGDHLNCKTIHNHFGI